MKKLIYIFFGALILSACQDLDLTPEHQLSDGSLWNRSEDFQQAVNLLYPSIGSHQRDLDSDIAFANSPNSASNGTRVAPATSGFYNNSYRDIRRCNFLIDRALANGFENDRFVAEARWFRVLFYSRLVEAYGDVPFYTAALDPASEALLDTRTSRETVVDFLLQELREIAPLLPSQTELSGSELGRITRGAADALRARIALFEGIWIKYHNTPGNSNERLDEAINASQAVISSGEYDLFNYSPDPDQSYRYFFMEVGNDSKEQIVARRYDGDRRHNFTNAVRDGGNTSTRKLADMYLCTDGLPIDQSPLFQGRSLMISEFQNRDRRMSATIIPPGTFAIDRLDQDGSGADFPTPIWDQSWYDNYKYISEFYFDGTGGSVFYYHMLRYAEVLLINAEAQYERNGSITDAQLDATINLLRARAGVADLTNALASANGLDMLTEIRRERTIELAHEGFRRGDLRRWKTAEVEMPMALMGAQFTGTEFETVLLPDGNLRYPDPPLQDTNGNIIVEPANQRSFDPTRDYLEPLPAEELVKNPNLVQNPNW
ncbi:RagB/SusD family nutrient uptake outer membrane protein [Fulvivirgaceae bacterium BMA10]|uniref:RagB/SusD family nutrient uptake outer membrane protein n=1 Tax=Splendidivirga corallicola TaxID=3051826 RepID=A0ABT8KVC5_9BACT|nr:RagB/SusD family nutrient uptake outer membrane protein [Fulvivirgaceae bacterium BMA10]